MSKKLSVITICYNIKDEIERTCESIVNQTNKNFEWIVVDGGSTDGTVEILNKYKKHIDVLISEPDKGIYNAMNKGIKRATGEFLNFMNGGDCFASSQVVDDFLKQDTDGVDIFYGNINVISNGSKTYLSSYPHKLEKLWFCKHCIGHQATFIRRELFEKYGLYNEQYRIVSDWEKWIIFIINRCVFEQWNYVVADFYDGGVGSTLSPRHIQERKEIEQKYFTEEERKMTEKFVPFSRFYILFNFLPLLQIKCKNDGNKYIVHLFNLIPLYKIVRKEGITKHYVFSFLQWLKIKEK